VDFTAARLAGTRLSGAVLPEAKFADADLSGADFTHVDVEESDFRGARNIPAALQAQLDKAGQGKR
jgi:uncharacterized protein YjbI with pentapeptide repeats